MPVALRGGSPACVVPFHRVERERRRSGKRRRHHGDGSEYVRPDQGAVRGHGRTGITAHHRSGAVSKSRYQPKRIPDQIGLTGHENVAVITVVPPHGPTIASHVRREYMKSCRSEGQHYIAPSIGKLRKSMQEQYTRSAFVVEPGFQDVKRKGVDITYVTGAYPGRKRNRRRVRVHRQHVVVM